MIIWRVENQEGRGCYRSSSPISAWIIKRHNDNQEQYPAPLSDGGIDRLVKWYEICGFKDLQQALDWFSRKEILKLSEEGFILKEVKVKEITAIGEKQILAIR